MNIRHTMLKQILLALTLFSPPLLSQTHAQQRPSMYGDRVRADVKLRYVYTLEDAIAQAQREHKPIFFNAFADWAVPCHAMNQAVFSDAAFGEWMNKHFVNLFIDVSVRENQAIGTRYGVKTFAHYLVLNERGEVQHRIVGGKKLPEFQQDLALALSPKTSLAGTTAAYQAQKRGKPELLAYFKALSLAADDSLRDVVARELVQKLSLKERASRKYWDAYSSLIDSYTAPYYEELVANKPRFAKALGDSAVNSVLHHCFYPEIAGIAAGNEAYDAAHLLDLYLKMQAAALPADKMVWTMYKVAKLRGEKQYDALIELMEAEGEKLRYERVPLELTFDFAELSEAQKQRIAGYLRQRAAAESASNAKYLIQLAERTERYAGIQFEDHLLPFAQAQTKAREQGKLIFVDAYTTWCGPCKRLSAEVFPQPEVGNAINPRFVALKIDMEKGEGPDLAQRYGVSAYPTLLLIRPDGTLIKSIVGYRTAEQLIAELSDVKP